MLNVIKKIVLIVFFIALAAVFFMLMKKMRAWDSQNLEVRNRTAAISALKKVYEAQKQYQSKYGEYALSNQELAKANMLEPDFAESIEAGKVRYGYWFLKLGSRSDWELIAVPNEPGISGRSSFFINNFGIMAFEPCIDKNYNTPGLGSPPFGQPVHKSQSNEADAISSLKTISCAQELYYTRHEKYGTLAELCKAKSLHESLEKAINPEHGKSGYYFLLTLTKDGWSCKAIPAVAGETGKRIFFVNQTGIIRTAPCESKDDPPANAKSPPLGR